MPLDTILFHISQKPKGELMNHNSLLFKMKNSLCNSVPSVAKKFLEYDEDGTPVYANELTVLDQGLRNLCADLLLRKGESPEEEAEILVALFKGYDTMLFNVSAENEQVIQELLDHSIAILEKLPVSVLKYQLLLECFEQMGDEGLIANLGAVLDVMGIM